MIALWVGSVETWRSMADLRRLSERADESACSAVAMTRSCPRAPGHQFAGANQPTVTAAGSAQTMPAQYKVCGGYSAPAGGFYPIPSWAAGLGGGRVGGYNSANPMGSIRDRFADLRGLDT